MKSKKLKLEKFRVSKLSNQNLINGGENGKGTDVGGQGETILMGLTKPTRPTRPTVNN